MAQQELSHYEAIVHSFVASRSSFRIVDRFPINRSSALRRDQSSGPSIETLFILDSSYNPPSIAHAALALTAFKSNRIGGQSALLLLFSTANADKSPKPASFAHRLAMIFLFAEDLSSRIRDEVTETQWPKWIDIALTTAAFYVDKTRAVDDARQEGYSKDMKQVQLIGFDTFVRFLDGKYYKNHEPPLSALAPFFDAGHRVEVLLRPNDNSDSDLNEQRRYVDQLGKGALTAEGFKTAWASQISMLECKDANSVSSTAVRSSAAIRDWDSVAKMVCPGVAEWVRDHGIYDTETEHGDDEDSLKD